MSFFCFQETLLTDIFNEVFRLTNIINSVSLYLYKFTYEGK